MHILALGCQASARAKFRDVAVSALFGRACQVPAESTWTHVIHNFKQCLFRRVAWSLGSTLTIDDCLRDLPETIQIDGEAVMNMQAFLLKTRLRRGSAYLSSDNEMYKDSSHYVCASF